ncbi:MAG: methyltransferase domain-containing protein [Vicinamibacterales bacterium]|jgi:precorrin-6B methylase 2|nr:SAM-dependent methyltransferase [Acidobacteriota bacterium]MDP6372926.1 methyltransferase domain-containing protein [Vicinamibacterales bacterium]MDP6607604.1 methyltransferase domain-containing protein [Vicinamibacterales bacterium]HAK54484.1 SAM-dependent methyltransferase [Acidobacteriota bacterium]|tara:strand:+ start:4045 stop:4707 length:663 start_codon:yes stop_codon:yes gene_type:complete
MTFTRLTLTTACAAVAAVAGVLIATPLLPTVHAGQPVPADFTGVTAPAPVPVDTSALQDSQSLAPYVPTPQEVVDRMLQLAEVGPDDVVYDLGSGDGRIPISAARDYGARGVGVDIDPERVAEANANARREGVSDRVSFILGDAMATDVSDATVVTLYLLSSSNLKLRPILTNQLAAGARIVSHAFSMGDWEADSVETFNDSRGNPRTLYFWRFDGQPRP